MISKTPNRTQRAAVVGLGTTGISCVRYLRSQGYEVRAFDTRPEPPGRDRLLRDFPDLETHTGSLDPVLFRDMDFAVVSPGVPLQHPQLQQVRAQGVELLGDVELFARANRRPVIAITGANGKSTVTTLVGEMCRNAGLQAAVAGNIGLPVLDALTAPPPDLYVLELSSFQLETTSSLNAAAATVLNITPDHMDRYAGLEEYAAAKARIFNGDGLMVLNRDDAWVLSMARPGRRQVTFALRAPEDADEYGLVQRADGPWLAAGERLLMPCAEVRLQGAHNWANVLAAFALVAAVELPVTAARAAAATFPGLRHRAEVVGERDGVVWINDSKGTNVGATAAALAGMVRPVVLIAGGDGKAADFRVLRDAVAGRVRALVLIGRDGPVIAGALQDLCPVTYASDLSDAVRKAAHVAHRGDVVLLSPACASFDMFRNFEHRGDVFRDAVRDLLGEGASAH